MIVWNTFKLKHLREYYDSNVTLNVLLLIDIFENLKKVSFDFYEPDCLTIFGLSWNRMLKITSNVFELFPDIDNHLFIEKIMRGGIYILLIDIVVQIIYILMSTVTMKETNI